MEGVELGPYRLVERLGAGGNATVYRAEVLRPVAGREAGDPVAVKVIHPHLLSTEGFFKRLLREVEIGKRIRHENVVRTLDLDCSVAAGATHHYLVMEYVEGQTLRALLEELEWASENLCRHIGREVTKAITAIHAAGIVHRDLKPENVLIAAGDVVKVMDLGIALVKDEALRLSRTGQFVGSVLYAAPEQFREGGRHVDARADLYALGLVLYELATGNHPFRDDDMRVVMGRQLTAIAPPPSERNPQVTPFFDDLVLTLLAKDPGERIGDAESLLAILTEGEESEWWKRRPGERRSREHRPLRRIRVPRETSLHGRAGEMDALRSLWRRVVDGEGRAVVIEGEAGIGKSRLVDEFAAGLVRDGEALHFLAGAYPPGGAATVAGAFSTAFREHLGEDRLPDALAPHLPDTPVLVPAFAALLKGEPPPEGGERLAKDSIQAAFAQVARSLAAARPTLILVDDLHFAPEEGRALFASLAHALAGHRLLLVGTSRPPLPEEWITGLERLSHISRLVLPRLGPRDLQLLLTEALRSERLARGIGASIAVKSDGNPFFVFEIIRALREERVLTRESDGSWVATTKVRDVLIPWSVKDMVQARIAGLEEEERDLLDVAACAGFEFDPVLVAEALERGRIPVLKRLSQLERSHRLVHAAGRAFVFDHHQVRSALLESLPELLREEYHAALSRSLERLHGEKVLSGALAVDYAEHSIRGGREEVARRTLDAALRHLEDGYLNEPAARLADLALRRPGLMVGTERVELMLRRATRLELLSWWEEMEEVLEEAVRLADGIDDAALRARARTSLGSLLLRSGRFAPAAQILREARDLARAGEEADAEAAACGTLGNAFRRLGRYEEARREQERSLEIARERRDLRAKAKATGNLAHLYQVLGRFEPARESYERCLETFRELGDRRHVAVATGNLGGLLQQMGRFEEAREMHERHLALCREIGYRAGEVMANENLGLLLSSLGRCAEALEHFERRIELHGEEGDARGEAVSWAYLGELLMAMGDLEEARRRLEDALAVFRETGNRPWEGFALLELGELAGMEGRAEEAEERLDAALRVFATLGRENAEPDVRIARGRLFLSLGREEEARAEVARAREVARGTGDLAVALRAVAWLATVDPDFAPEAAALLETEEGGLPHATRIEVRVALHRATGSEEHLAAARDLLEFRVEHTPPGRREEMLARVPLLRELRAALGS